MTLAYWVLLAVLTHLPKPPGVPGPGDKTQHFLAYFVLSGLLYATLWAAGSGAWRAAGVVVLASLAFGATDEITQPWVGRFCELADWLADAAGTLAAVAIMAALRWARTRGSESGAASPASDAAG